MMVILGYALCVFVGIFLGMMTLGICAISGNAERDAEYQRHIDYLVTLLRANTAADFDRWRTDTFAAPPDEDDGCEPAARLVSVGGVRV